MLKKENEKHKASVPETSLDLKPPYYVTTKPYFEWMHNLTIPKV